MAKKLFAMEDADVLDDGAEMEVTPEEGEVADVQVEVNDDVAEVAEAASAIQDGEDAGSDLEEVQDLVETAASDEGEGLDPVAAEAIRIAVKAICARVGADPKSVYSLYASENFKSAGSRKANTRYALEGIGEFLKNLWARIKAALTSLWEKVKSFWDKHVSSLGRSLKALESMKEKISTIKGTPSNEAIAVPASLASIFPVKATLGTDEIDEYFKRIQAAGVEVDKFKLLEDTAKAATLSAIEAAVTSSTTNGLSVKFGNENAPMPGGGYFSWNFKLEEEDDDGVKVITLDTDEDHGTYTGARKDPQMDFASKDKLKAMITNCITITKATIKYRDKVVQRGKTITNNMKAIDKEIDAADKAKAGAGKAGRATIRAYNLVMSKGPMIETKYLGLQLAFVKGVLGYASVCLKNFK